MCRKSSLGFKDHIKVEDYFTATEAAIFLTTNKERLQRLCEAGYKNFPKQHKITINRNKVFYKKSEVQEWASKNDPNEVVRKELIRMIKEKNPKAFVQSGCKKAVPLPVTPFSEFLKLTLRKQDGNTSE